MRPDRKLSAKFCHSSGGNMPSALLAFGGFMEPQLLWAVCRENRLVFVFFFTFTKFYDRVFFIDMPFVDGGLVNRLLKRFVLRLGSVVAWFWNDITKFLFVLFLPFKRLLCFFFRPPISDTVSRGFVHLLRLYSMRIFPIRHLLSIRSLLRRSFL